MTAKRDDLAPLPYWPRLLSEEQAAAYCGMSATHFRNQVKAKAMPGPLYRSRSFVRWDREAIDRRLNTLSGFQAVRAQSVEETAFGRLDDDEVLSQ